MHRKPTPTERIAETSADTTSRPRAGSHPQQPQPLRRVPHQPPAARGRALRAPELEELWAGYFAARKQPGIAPETLESWRNALLEHHLPLVRFVAERLARTLPRSVQIDDLVSAGVFGLMDALRGFDPARAVRFKTYAAARVRGAILDRLRSEDWVPRLVRQRAARLEKAVSALRERHGREPTHAELAAELGLDGETLAAELVDAEPRAMHGLSDRRSESEHEPDHEWTREDARTPTPLDQVAGREALRALLAVLTHKERFILEQYYEVGHTMREIGEMLDISESRICQIHTSVLARLRAHCERARRQEEG